MSETPKVIPSNLNDIDATFWFLEDDLYPLYIW